MPNKLIFVLIILLSTSLTVLSEENNSGKISYEDELTALLNNFNALKDELAQVGKSYQRLKDESEASSGCTLGFRVDAC
jgi:hypothetical protein